jgi:uncharacterized coiled-coil protein SlyX
VNRILEHVLVTGAALIVVSGEPCCDSLEQRVKALEISQSDQDLRLDDIDLVLPNHDDRIALNKIEILVNRARLDLCCPE